MASTAAALRFASYRLDPRGHTLWHGEEPVRLPPKAFNVLHYLVVHAGRLVTKHELLDQVWADVHVGDAVLKVAIREIRQALADDAHAPQFVQTTPRIGYRFIAPVSSAGDLGSSAEDFAADSTKRVSDVGIIVGRDGPLASLTAAMARAARGARQVVFVAGEAGIGKTTLAEEFLRGRERTGRIRVARGQCLEHAGGAEAYMPVLDALGRIARGAGREDLVAALRQFAPTWLAQMPALNAEPDALKRETVGATSDRMLREIGEALESFTVEVPLVLFLDDLHWSDDATLDFVSMTARRSERARLLLVATYRPVDVVLNRTELKTLKQELAAKGLCEEIALDFLSPADVVSFFDARFPGHTFPPALTSLVHERTDGNPLFMVNLVDDLVSQGLIAQAEEQWQLRGSLEAVGNAAPDSLHQLLEAQLDRLSPEEHAALEAASVAGIEFAAASVAAALEIEEEQAERCLDGLVRRGQFVAAAGIGQFPDGRWSPRYGFIHSLHQEVLYRGLSLVRRLRLHLRVAEALERLYATRASEFATELSQHFEQGRDYARALAYLRQTASNDVQRFANREAGRCLERAVDLVRLLPGEQRLAAHVATLHDLGRVRRSMGDMRGSSEAFLEAAQEGRQKDRKDVTVESLLLAASALTWFDGPRCLAAGLEAEELAATMDGTLWLQVRGYSAYWRLLWNGWNDTDAGDCEEALALARRSDDRIRLFSLLARCAYVRLARSQYAAAAAAAQESGDLALAANDAFGRMVNRFYGAWAQLLAGRWGDAHEMLRETERFAGRNGHGSWAIQFQLLRAWLLREIGAFETARSVAERAFNASCEMNFPFGELVGQTQLGLALIDMNRYEEGVALLERLLKRLDHEAMLMGWLWGLPVHLGLSDAYRGLKSPAQSMAHAEHTCNVAAQCGERTWLARGWMAQGETARSMGLNADADHAVAQALAFISDDETPTAAWRIHARVAEWRLAQNRTEDALHHRAAAEGIVRQLTQSLGPTSELGRMFLASPEVQQLLASI
jgi:DNA-binding winged helix-turn-helix (wHTH) protein/tetratricopeptide (TPR) repeat protein